MKVTQLEKILNTLGYTLDNPKGYPRNISDMDTHLVFTIYNLTTKKEIHCRFSFKTGRLMTNDMKNASTFIPLIKELKTIYEDEIMVAQIQATFGGN